MVYLKTYNEVALLFKGEASDVLRGMPAYKDEPERMIAVTINGIRFIKVYCVNGEAIRAPNSYTNKHGFLPYTYLYTPKHNSMKSGGAARF